MIPETRQGKLPRFPHEVHRRILARTLLSDSYNEVFSPHLVTELRQRRINEHGELIFRTHGEPTDSPPRQRQKQLVCQKQELLQVKFR
jgi:hypothetical protein